jgi:hypothetical protein
MQSHYKKIWWPQVTSTPQSKLIPNIATTPEINKHSSKSMTRCTKTVEHVLQETLMSTSVLHISEDANHSRNFIVDPSSIYLIMDVEGPADWPIEMSILAIQNRHIIDVFHQYALPQDANKIQKEAPYCHCISLEVLKNYTKLQTEDLLNLGKAFANKYTPSIIISNDNTSSSDIARITERWNIDLIYENVYLGDWRFRPQFHSHLVANKCKHDSINICNISCDFKKIHCIPFKLPKKKDNINTTQLAKLDHGAHCSLYDCLELYLFITLNYRQ